MYSLWQPQGTGYDFFSRWIMNDTYYYQIGFDDKPRCMIVARYQYVL